MAGHSKYANIKHRKNAQDSKRSKLFTKLIRQIQTAARNGPDPKVNPMLRIACENARVLGLNKDRVEAAIERANQGGATKDEYESIRYNAIYGEVAIIIELSTDNRNRSAGEVRSILTKNGGLLAETGSADYLFRHIGLIEYNANNIFEEKLTETCLELDVLDIVTEEERHYIKTRPESLHKILSALTAVYGDAENAQLYWEPINYLTISKEKEDKLHHIIELLEELDDIDEVYTNVEFKGN